MNLIVIFVVLSVINVSKSSTLVEKKDILQQINSDEDDLFYNENTEEQKIYLKLRHYGVPSDVAHMYVPRLTMGEALGTPKDTNIANNTHNIENSSAFDPWSIIWYIGSFGGLIAFFLVISCSEWCCLKSRSTTSLISAQLSGVPQTARRSPIEDEVPKCDSPPPGYHLFAPPSYNDSQMLEKTKVDVFVVPVHYSPPKYGDIFGN